VIGSRPVRLWAVLCLLLGLLQLACLPSVYAQFPGAPLNVPATLEAETTAPAPGGNVTLAFVMKPKPGWHGYWVNGGDAGVGMRLEWALPPGVSAGPLRYPVPERLIISGLMNYIYERPYTLLVDLKVDPSVARGTALPIRVRGDWLACTDKICVPEGDNLAINLTAGDGSVSAAKRKTFDDYRAALPVPIDQKGRYQIEGKSIAIAIPYPADAALDEPYFYAETDKLIAYTSPQMARRKDDMLIIQTGVDAYAIGDFKGGPIKGVLRYGTAADGSTRGIIVEAEQGEVPADGVEGGAEDMNFIAIFGLALLGGMILNLMPCVFPILGLKALSLAKMGGDEGAARRDAIAYTGGVILTCMALGGVMLALRAGGEQVGWAFQLQEPRIVLALLLLMVAVTVNLFGGFELGAVTAGGTMAQKPGAQGAFWTGVLAAVVATPCTGPFMAAALGAALLLPVGQALLLFAGLGLGLALPYLAIAFLPAARRMLPKPGPWLDTFRRVMGIPMVLTVAALLWLLWRLSGGQGLLIAAGAVLLLGLLLIVYGRMQRKGSGMAGMLAIAVGLSVAAIALLPKEPVVAAKKVDALLPSEAYSEALLARYRAEGHPVFVYFTADWCVTCKVNEAAAIEREETAVAFKKAGVKVLVGDFTRADPLISRALSQYGRSGVPLYLYFGKGADAEILPQILTPDMLISRAKKEAGTNT
jgi:DsbC/DsbD-like thiol-disulfide interchange protein/cytochrome c biogenesis protein CcdA/thiol-disulfide isomerase/thioredoxin